MPSQLLLRRRFAVCFPAVPRRNGWGTVRFRRTPPPPGSIRLTGRSTTDADLAQAGFCGGMLRGAMTGRLPPVAFPLRHLFRKKKERKSPCRFSPLRTRKFRNSCQCFRYPHFGQTPSTSATPQSGQRSMVLVGVYSCVAALTPLVKVIFAMLSLSFRSS